MHFSKKLKFWGLLSKGKIKAKVLEPFVKIINSKQMDFIVESDVIIRAVDKPFNERLQLGLFETPIQAYQFIEKYLQDTKDLHTYFSRNYLCSKDELDDRIANDRIIAINVVLGQFEDMIYIRKSSN